jgi:1,2-phenylacetyl-CoA epoxidase catalytic subunit
MTGKGKKVIGDQSMPNILVCKLINAFNQLAELCIIVDYRRLEWMQHVGILGSTVMLKG